MPVRSDTPARAAARARFAHFVDDETIGDVTDTVDPENPPMTDVNFARLRPAAEVVPALVEAKRKAGRPKSATSKVAVSIRLDADVIEALRASGDGWQGRANDMLRRALWPKPPSRSAGAVLKRNEDANPGEIAGVKAQKR